MALPTPSSIHPFKLSIAQSTLDDLQMRLRLTRWPDKETVSDWSQGVPLAAIRELCEYWQTKYDWRRCESLLNSYPQFTTTIDGVEFYFLHIRSKLENALPLLLTHGWPGSVLEFRHAIDKLVDPESHGGSPEDAFHLVIPALPGYAFSGKPTETGWDYHRTARAWAELMQRLGYADSGWVAQGGDWGAHVAASLGHQAPMGLKSVHFNSIFFEPKKEVQVPIHDTKGEERAMYFDGRRDAGHRGYSLQQSTRPQTIGYGLADSPVGQAAWIYEKFRDWSHHDGNVETVFSKDEMLDTIMLYWLSNSGTSSARYYWECKPDSTAWPIDIPVGVSWFGGDNSYAPKEWCERYYKNIVYWNETERGGHFAAWEVPDLFVAEQKRHDNMAPIYPKTAPIRSGHLQVSSVHSIYWEECGLPTGTPVVYLHGGPGAGFDESDRQYFDPSHYRSVLFDQRGSGKSTPHASLEENTTWHLVEDIEKLREHLGIDKWVVFGGSWGSTLSLAYAETHPDRCLGLILRGIFTLRREELLWFYQKGADFLFADFFDDYAAVIPEDERGDMMQAYYKRLTGDDEAERLICADAWSRWENSTSKLMVDPAYIARSDDSKWALAFARIESHYFVNGGFMKDGQLIEDAHKIKHLPIVIIQGRYDIVCPAKTSWDLYKALGGKENKNVEYKVIGDAGHSAHEVTIESALVDATEKFKSITL